MRWMTFSVGVALLAGLGGIAIFSRISSPSKPEARYDGKTVTEWLVLAEDRNIEVSMKADDVLTNSLLADPRVMARARKNVDGSGRLSLNAASLLYYEDPIRSYNAVVRAIKSGEAYLADDVAMVVRCMSKEDAWSLRPAALVLSQSTTYDNGWSGVVEAIDGRQSQGAR